MFLQQTHSFQVHFKRDKMVLNYQSDSMGAGNHVVLSVKSGGSPLILVLLHLKKEVDETLLTNVWIEHVSKCQFK